MDKENEAQWISGHFLPRCGNRAGNRIFIGAGFPDCTAPIMRQTAIGYLG